MSAGDCNYTYDQYLSSSSKHLQLMLLAEEMLIHTHKYLVYGITNKLRQYIVLIYYISASPQPVTSTADICRLISNKCMYSCLLLLPCVILFENMKSPNNICNSFCNVTLTQSDSNAEEEHRKEEEEEEEEDCEIIQCFERCTFEFQANS